MLPLRGKRYYHKNNTNEKRELKINNVVLIQDDKITPHNNWRKGKVKELIVSRDSKIRGTVLRVYQKKKGHTFLLKRPVKNLIPLEIMNCVKGDNENFPNLITNRQQRKVGLRGQLRRRINDF